MLETMIDSFNSSLHLVPISSDKALEGTRKVYKTESLSLNN